MKKYSEYKDSGIEWIGEIPSHWEVKRLKHLVEEPLKYGANESANDENPANPRYIRITDFGKDGNLRNDTFKSLPLEIAKDYLLKEGDLLFARSGATVGKTFLFKGFSGDACFAGYLIKASVKKNLINSSFLAYLTKSNFYENWKKSIFQQATIQNIGADKYNNLMVPVPKDCHESTSIANYLDHKSQEIDSLIAKKQQLITLYQEEKTATINQAVTKGLDPNVPMKDSGIEWLEEIPSHWEVKKFKRVSYMKGRIGWQGLKQSEFSEDKNLPYLITGMNFKDGKIRWNEVYHISEERYNEAPEIQLQVGDVLMTKDGTIGKLLFVGDLPNKASLNSHLLVFRALEKSYYPKFLYYQLQSENFKIHVELTKTGTTFYGISQEAVGKYKILLPPYHEQKEITKSLEETLHEFENLISKTQKEIELLKEYKTAFISEVVLGKIDVREEVLEEIK
ncbi:restriction endonuclease subunit S [Xanthovirga aplysinae]|uniref:restriction endonuclease subunit S n=1 Tax=Xanthovirga aplysinae TaxID=2529853 RepID=UPI0012BD4757|nr:restriction endonuclease subunit S [Xanthovirga aplysinae]MTI31690.1 restriction endonuclease subunit S [Xanthovirga aplysinae]